MPFFTNAWNALDAPSVVRVFIPVTRLNEISRVPNLMGALC